MPNVGGGCSPAPTLMVQSHLQPNEHSIAGFYLQFYVIIYRSTVNRIAACESVQLILMNFESFSFISVGLEAARKASDSSAQFLGSYR